MVPSLQYSELSVPACTGNRWCLYESTECCMTVTAIGLSPRPKGRDRRGEREQELNVSGQAGKSAT